MSKAAMLAGQNTAAVQPQQQQGRGGGGALGGGGGPSVCVGRPLAAAQTQQENGDFYLGIVSFD